MSYRFKYFRGFDAPAMRNGNGSAKKSTRNIFLIFLAILFYVFLYMQSVGLDYELKNLRRVKERYLAENKLLEISMKSMMSNQGVEIAAKSKYGFKEPDPGQIYIIKK